MTSGAAFYHNARVAAGYAFARPPVHQRILDAVRTNLRIATPCPRALDVGCGSGRSTAALEPLARQIVGIDPAAPMLDHRRQVAPLARFVVGRAEHLPFADAACQLVTAAGSINYAGIDPALAEVARVLAPGGVFVIYDFAAGRRFADGPQLEDWYAAFDSRYPDPPGYAIDVTTLPFDRAGLLLDRHEELRVAVAMTTDSYARYVMSETRIELALARGASEADVHAWCNDTLTAVFGAGSRDVLFDCWFACVRHRGEA